MVWTRDWACWAVCPICPRSALNPLLPTAMTAYLLPSRGCHLGPDPNPGLDGRRTTGTARGGGRCGVGAGLRCPGGSGSTRTSSGILPVHWSSRPVDRGSAPEELDLGRRHRVAVAGRAGRALGPDVRAHVGQADGEGPRPLEGGPDRERGRDRVPTPDRRLDDLEALALLAASVGGRDRIADNRAAVLVGDPDPHLDLVPAPAPRRLAQVPLVGRRAAPGPQRGAGEVRVAALGVPGPLAGAGRAARRAGTDDQVVGVGERRVGGRGRRGRRGGGRGRRGRGGAGGAAGGGGGGGGGGGAATRCSTGGLGSDSGPPPPPPGPGPLLGASGGEDGAGLGGGLGLDVAGTRAAARG